MCVWQGCCANSVMVCVCVFVCVFGRDAVLTACQSLQLPSNKLMSLYEQVACMLQCVAVCCSVLQCIGVCCSVLQCVAVCCSVLLCVAVCCSVLQCSRQCLVSNILILMSSIAFRTDHLHRNTLQHTPTQCNTLQHIATHSDTLQHTARHSNTLQ